VRYAAIGHPSYFNRTHENSNVRSEAHSRIPTNLLMLHNVRDQPIGWTPEEAFHCFIGTDIESLAVGDCVLCREKQDPQLIKRYERRFELD
jgi:carbamoyltransferase